MLDPGPSIPAEDVRARVQAHLDKLGYPVRVGIGDSASGWPLVARMATPADARWIELARLDEEPLEDNSVEATTAVISNLVCVLYDEWIQLHPSK